MRKGSYVNLTITLGLLLLGVILVQPPKLGPGVLDAESNFYPALHNSLYYLDQAKWKWMEEKHKTEHDVPTMEDLAPYLGDWTNHIARFVTLGITYKITPISELDSQSDIAALTRDLRFQRGFCRFYPAGTSYCIHTGWTFPQSSTTYSFRAFYINNQYLLAAALCVLAVGNLLVFVIKRMRCPKEATS
jgi:hypothetical protein